MKVHAVAAERLDNTLLGEWSRLRNAQPTLASPFFSAAFTQAVAAERPGVQVAVVEQFGRVVGILPFFRSSSSVASTPAASFADVQGLICERDAAIDLRQILRACGLTAWRFRNLPTDQTPAQPFLWARSEAPFIDLSRGFQAYYDERRKRGTQILPETLRKARKLEREVAPLRFESALPSHGVLDQLIVWKREQLQRLRLPDGFAPSWVLPLLHRLLDEARDELRPMLSALYVGDNLAAASFALRSGHVLHGWITAYDPAWQRFSPGLILLARLAEAAAALGIQRIDLGSGDEAFKRSLASGTIALAEGAVDLRPVSRAVHRTWVHTKAAIRDKSWARAARRWVRGVRAWGVAAAQ